MNQQMNDIVAAVTSVMLLGVAFALMRSVVQGSSRMLEASLSSPSPALLPRTGSSDTRTLYLTAEVQDAMLDLIKRTKGKKVEYGMELLLEDDLIIPGGWKWGAGERIRASEEGIGWFHTHPYRPDVYYRLMKIEPPPPPPPKLSMIDILHILVSPTHRIIGVGGTETFLVKTVPYGLEESSEVQIAILKKKVPPELREEILGIMPMVAALGTPVENIEEYYEVLTFDLSKRRIPLEVYVGE